MDCDRFLYRTPIDQLINLLQEIPFPGSAGYIVFRKTHTQHLNIIVLKRNYSIQSIDQGSQPCKGLTLYQLKKMGLKLAMDDFGTGYSSMARMLDLPLDEVKIDMIFVRHMATRHKHERIVDSMITLAHRLNLSVVAEGVEDLATYQRLRTLGCDVIQGYLIGKAMPLPELIEAVNNQSFDFLRTSPNTATES
jgi:c-di-GMP-related signal transduction protein